MVKGGKNGIEFTLRSVMMKKENIFCYLTLPSIIIVMSKENGCSITKAIDMNLKLLQQFITVSFLLRLITVCFVCMVHEWCTYDVYNVCV